MFSEVLTFIPLLLIAVILGIALCYLFLRFSILPLLLTLTAFIFDSLIGTSTAIITIDPYNIYLMDLLSFVLISMTFLRFLFIRVRFKKEFIPIVLLIVLLFVSWLRGTMQFGVEMSTNAMRASLYFFAVLLYTLTLDLAQIYAQKFSFWLGMTSLILVFMALVRWILVGLEISSSVNWIAPSGKMIRVIYAAATFLLLQIQIFIFYFHDRKRNKFFTFLGSMIIIIMIIVLQHRTVWVVLLVTANMILLINSKHRGGIILGFFLLLTLIVLTLQLNFFSIDNLSGTSFDLSSFSWRILGWQNLISPDRFSTILDFIIGQPFGTGYARYIVSVDYATTVNPHNNYVQLFLNIGSLGLITVLLYYGYLLKSLWNLRINKLSIAFILLLVNQLIYFITYSPSYEQGIFLGLATLYVIKERNTKPVPGQRSIQNENIS